jgi:hypothetical protein
MRVSASAWVTVWVTPGASAVCGAQVRAVYIEPVSGRGFVAIDGEQRPVTPVVAEILPGLARLIIPAESPHAPPRTPPSPRSTTSK